MRDCRIGSERRRGGRSQRMTERAKEVSVFVMTSDMRAKLDRIYGTADVVKVDGRKTRTWTKAQRKAIGQRLAAGRKAKATK